jgi:hypothetical protein
VLDQHTMEMNAWFEASFNAFMSQHTARIDNVLETIGESFRTIEKQFEEIGEAFGDVGVSDGQQDKNIFELLEIVKVLADGNDFLSGRIDQISRDFRAQHGITQQKTVETRTTIEQQRTSRVSQVVRTIDEILAN